MKKTRLPFLAAACVAAAALTGCGTAYDTTYHGPEVEIEPAHNWLGIVTLTPHSFQPVSPATLDLRTSEVFATRNLSGNNVKLFWGAITITGY
jgi:hypothetical protein